ncbi:hypothetical protein GOV12_00985 [Candidatus Pacearchaeota archaeon]|nr:hypothetical protein [Candidatus Pacearchaeota archaeon]
MPYKSSEFREKDLGSFLVSGMGVRVIRQEDISPNDLDDRYKYSEDNPLNCPYVGHCSDADNIGHITMCFSDNFQYLECEGYRNRTNGGDNDRDSTVLLGTQVEVFQHLDDLDEGTLDLLDSGEYDVANFSPSNKLPDESDIHRVNSGSTPGVRFLHLSRYELRELERDEEEVLEA